VAQAQVLMAQSSNSATYQKPTAKQIEQGRKLVEAGDFASAIAIYQRAASVEPKSPNFSALAGYHKLIRKFLSCGSLSTSRRPDPNNATMH